MYVHCLVYMYVYSARASRPAGDVSADLYGQRWLASCTTYTWPAYSEQDVLFAVRSAMINMAAIYITRYWEVNADWLRCIEVRICRLRPAPYCKIKHAVVRRCRCCPYCAQYRLCTLTSSWCMRTCTEQAGGGRCRADFYGQRWLGIVYHVASL